MDPAAGAYSADRSLKGKLRRRVVRLQARRRFRRPDQGPVVTFSFDDIPATAAEAGAAVLEAAGARGVFYVCAGLAGGDGPMGRYAQLDQIADLAARGHEIGCHSFSHLDCGQAEGARIAEDVARNDAALRRLGVQAESFAYPYGDVSLQAKQALGPRFGSLRALHKDVIGRGGDLNQLPAVGIEGEDGEAVAARWIDRALSRGAWLILYTHDVAERPSPWGCTPGALRRLVSRARDGGAAIQTVREAVARLELSE